MVRKACESSNRLHAILPFFDTTSLAETSAFTANFMTCASESGRSERISTGAPSCFYPCDTPLPPTLRLHRRATNKLFKFGPGPSLFSSCRQNQAQGVLSLHTMMLRRVYMNLLVQFSLAIPLMRRRISLQTTRRRRWLHWSSQLRSKRLPLQRQNQHRSQRRKFQNGFCGNSGSIPIGACGRRRHIEVD